MGAGVEYKYLKILSNTIENISPTIENSDYVNAYGYPRNMILLIINTSLKRGWFLKGIFIPIYIHQIIPGSSTHFPLQREKLVSQPLS